MSDKEIKIAPNTSQVVRVCPDKDIVCGDSPARWCATCPKAKAAPSTSPEPVAKFVSDGDCGHVQLLAHTGDPLVDGQELFAAPSTRPEITDEDWLAYLLRNATKSVLSVAAFESGGVWKLRSDANELRKLVEAANKG